MVEVGTAKRLGDSWFLVSDSGRYEIPINEAWRLSPIEGQRYRFTPGTDGWALGKSIELLGAAMLKFEVGRIYRLRDLDNNAVWDAQCIYETRTLEGGYFCWAMKNNAGLVSMVDTVDNVKVEGEYNDWPEPFPQHLSKDGSRFVDGIKTHHMIPLEEREKADLCLE